MIQTATVAKEGKEDGFPRSCGYFYGWQSCFTLPKCRLIKGVVLRYVLHYKIVILKGILLFFFFFQTQKFHVKGFVLPIFCLEEKKFYKPHWVFKQIFLFSSLPILYISSSKVFITLHYTNFLPWINCWFAKFRQNMDLKILMFNAFTFL